MANVLMPVPGATSEGFILETATVGANPQPAIGLGGLQWVGARFSTSRTVQVEHIGANIEGASTIFGAIVRLNGPKGLPAFLPSQIVSNALASTVFSVTTTVQDVFVPLSVTLTPGDYGVVFGVGPFGAGGGANLTGGNVPTAQSSFFSAELVVTPEAWFDQPTFSGLRVFVLGAEPVERCPRVRRCWAWVRSWWAGRK